MAAYIDVRYTINYNANSGSGAPSATTGTKYDVEYGSTFYVSLASGKPSRTGYDFLGWSTSSGGSASYQAGGSFPIQANNTSFSQTLYAVWRKKTYTIRYNKGANGTGTNTSDTKTYDVELTLKGAIFTRTGYTQTGWSTTDGGSKTYDLSASYTTNAATTLYPFWTANTYDVFYNKGVYGTGTNTSDTKTHDVALTLKGAIFTRNGYTQTGWSTSDGGSKTYNLSASYTNNASVTLYPFWSARLSTVDASNGDLGSARVLTITRYSSSFTSTITYKYGNSTGTIVSKTSDTSISWTPPLSLASQFPNATSGKCILTITTYSGNTSLGSTTKEITLSIPASVKPTATINVTQKGNSVAINWGVYVQGYSYASFSITANGIYSSTVTSLSIVGENISKQVSGNTLTIDSNIFDASGTKTFTISVSDSRGRANTYTYNIVVYEYSTPSLVGFDAYRSDSSGIADEADGEYLTVKADQFKYSSCNGNNVVSVTYKFKVATITTWTTITSSAVQNTNYIRAADTEINYDVQAEISDSFGNKQILKDYVSSINIALALGLLNDRARFGGVPRGPGLEVDWDAKFDGAVDIVSRRSYATLSNAGWYRVCSYSRGTILSGALIKFKIIEYGDNSGQSSNHEITLSLTTEGAAFVDERSNGVSTAVKKIRLMRSNNDPYNMYVDVFFDYNTSKTIDAYFEPFVYVPYQKRISPENLRLVSDAPSDEIAIVTYDFSESVHAIYLKYYDDSSVANYTIGNNNYVAVQYPQDVRGRKIVSITIIAWASNSGAFTIMPYGDNAGTNWYIIGNSGTTINGVRFRYWYI